MPIKSLKFKAGIVSDITSYSNEGGFVDGDKVRFRFGFPEKFGGWTKYSANTYEGSARRLHNWVALDGSDFLGLGTELKYYIEEGQSFNDITPIRNTTSAGDVTFSASNGSTTITVTDPAHGANENDFVTFSGAATLGGTITATILNIEYKIVTIISSNSYTVTSSVAANGSDSGNGGSSVVGTYQLNTGLNTTVGGTGWGAGQWSGTTSGALSTQLNEALDNSETAVDVDDETGMNTANDVILVEEELMLVSATTDDNTMTVTRGHSGTTAATHADNTLVRLAVGNALVTDDFVGWGSAASITVPGAQIRLWSHDNFGEDLLLNARDSGIFYWDRTNGLGNRAVELSTAFSGQTSVPQIAKQVLVSDQDRHVIAFGCDGFGANSTATQGDGVQDPLLIRFSSQENPVDFFPTATNTAGDLRLGGGSTFVQAVETKQQILCFTNKTLHAMKFIGPPFTFGLQELSKNITIMSSAAAVAIEDSVFWMGVDTFYLYSGGQTLQLPCTVKDKVFLDFNFEEKDKVHAGVNSEFSELLWFYPTKDSTEIDAYVAYNYIEKVWYYGTLERQAWLDRGIRTLPIATGGQYLYNHEVGFDDDGSAMTSFIESAPIDIGDGDKFVSLKRVIPDVTFDGSTSVNPDVSFTMKVKNFPGSNFNQTTQGNTQRSATSPVEQFTEKLDYRLRGRSFVLRIDSTSLGTKYKLGTPRVDIREDGRR
mgnify:CR=1 FL=1|tara:strand:+ start:1266 stop:3401 length:2136 start_codon:yes stop_codon:yes gene_type:complete